MKSLVLLAGLLAAAAALPAALPAEEAAPAPDTDVPDAALAVPAGDALPAAASQVASIEEDVAKTVEDTGPKNNKKRSQSSSAGNLLAPLLQTPDVTPETVSLSPQVIDPPKKGNAVQGLLLNILQPKPIVDMIREEEKYGNTGDRFAFIGRGVVAGFEGFSNILNKVLDFPFETAKKVSRSATEALNNLGSKLIGL